MNTITAQSTRHDTWANLLLMVWGVLLLGSHVVAAGPYSGDIAELTLCAWAGGVPHSPGYPLWTRLAEMATFVQPNVDPIHAIGRMGVLIACLAALVTRRFLRDCGADVWAATAAAALLFVVPIGIRSFSIPEVFALDLLLIAGSFAAWQRGQHTGIQAWTGLGIATAILATGHRPINVIVLLVVGLGLRFKRTELRGAAWGLVGGIAAQGLLYLDLWMRIADPTTAWVDEHAMTTMTGFGRFVLGLPFEHFFVWPPSSLGIASNPLFLGLQATALVFAGLLAPLLIRPTRLGWSLWIVLAWHLLFISVYRVADPETLFLPVIWIGTLCVGLSLQRWSLPHRIQPGKALLIMVLILSVINHRGLEKPGHEAWQQALRTVLSSVPKDTILLSDNWKSRTGLVAVREFGGVGETVDVVRISLDGGDVQRLDEWFQGLVPLMLLEERVEISAVRPVRLHDGRLLPLLIEHGLLTVPAEAGTWSVTRPATAAQ
jgi:hypothetical protein